VTLDQIADSLPDDPVVTGNRVPSFLEVTQKLGAGAADVVPLIGYDIVLRVVWVPFAEPSNDEAAIGLPRVESGQHMPAPTLEAGLEIARTVGDLARIDDGLSVLERCLLEPALR
jgi:hypothetical protein